MAEPPSYEESASSDQYNGDSKDNKAPEADRQWNILDEVGISRSQHVASTVSKLVPILRDRARSGLSRTTLALLPSESDPPQYAASELVGFLGDEAPIVVQLEGRENGLEFWSQNSAIRILREQMLSSLVAEHPVLREQPLPTRELPAARKSSFFGRKHTKAAESKVPTEVAPVTVNAGRDEINFRSETEFGLYETVRKQAVIISVVVR